jgi:hypothetical protein
VVFRTQSTVVFVTPDVKNGQNNQKLPKNFISLGFNLAQVNPTNPPSTRKSFTRMTSIRRKT